MVNLLVAAALAAAQPTSASEPALVHDEPAMFVVHDSDTTVYIFGTFHVLDRRTQWFGERVRDAFEQSNELVLETLVPENATPIATRDQRLRRLPVTPSASFLATTRMAINAGQAEGMEVDNGADMVLRRAAEAEGKQVQGLETLQSQLDMFNRMPPRLDSDQRPPRAASGHRQPMDMASMESLSRTMAAMQSAWKRGDQTVFVSMLGQLESASPDTYRMLFTERNTRWADWIKARMQEPGTVFVAVGAGHLAGKDSLLVRLAERGIPSRRVN